MSGFPSRDPAASVRDELLTLAAEDAAALLVDASGRLVLWATPAGARLLGASSAERLVSAGLDPAAVSAQRLAELAALNALDAAPRMERLRVVAARRAEMVTFACRRFAVGEYPPMLLLVALGPRRRSGRDERASDLPAVLAPPPAASEPTETGQPGPDAAGERTDEPTVESLRAAAGGRSLLRFVWQTDAEGHFVTDAPSLLAVAGSRCAVQPGKAWADLIAAGLDDGGRLRDALDSQSTFTNVEAMWPVGDGSHAVPVALSGVPDALRGGAVAFRGFGLVRIDGLRWIGPADRTEREPEPAIETPAAASALSESDTLEQEAQSSDRQQEAQEPVEAGHPVSSDLQSVPPDEGISSAPDDPLVDDPLVLAQRIVDGLASYGGSITGEGLARHVEDEATAGELARPSPNDSSASSDEVAWKEDARSEPAGRPRAAGGGAVVPFDQVKGSARGTLADTKVVPLRSGTVPLRPEPESGLSRSERHAFREIARALGARIEGDDEEPPVRSKPVNQPVVEAAVVPAPGSGAPASTEAPADGAPESLTGEDDDARSEQADTPAIVDAFATVAETGLETVTEDDEAGEPEQAEPAESAVKAEAEPAGEPGPMIGVKTEAELQTEPERAGEPEPEPERQFEAERQFEPERQVEAERQVEPERLSEFARHADLVFDRLPVGILVSRGDVPIAMNRTLLDLLGWDTIDDFHADGGLGRLFRGRSGLAMLGTDGGTVALQTRDGDIVGVDARLQQVTWDDLPATLMTFRRAVDAEFSPKLKAAELEHRRLEGDARELRAMLDTATDGVIVLDEAGRIQSINRSGEALFGYDQSEIAGETFISLFAPDSHATALDYLEGLKSNGVASVLNDGREVIGRVRQGGRIPLFMTLGAISDPPGRKFCAVLRDITPWKKAEADLLEAKRAAEEASAQKSDFLAKMSHEIRTPLSAIIGFAEVMMEERFGPVGNERYLEYLRDIHASGGHVISLVNDLLDLSKIEAGRFDLSFVSVDVNESVSRSVALIQPQAGSARVVVRTALAQRLPRVVADERSMRQIVLNLLSNAVKFTDPGGQVIVSTAMTDRGEVAIRVRDTGIGMSDKDIETALEPFRQVATARRAGGTGLGLPLTKALVEANRASLTIRSARDSGTLVEILFPTTRVLAE